MQFRMSNSLTVSTLHNIYILEFDTESYSGAQKNEQNAGVTQRALH